MAGAPRFARHHPRAVASLAGSELRPSETQILWIVDAYALVFAALLLPAGALGDRFGRKGALLIGLVIFAVASAVCAFMTNANALIACRAIMGIGAALIMPSTLSLLQSCFPRRERAKAIAMWAGFAGAGGAIGPVLGGLLVGHFWYGSVFLVAAPIAAIAFVAAAILAPKSREAVAHALDFRGAALSIAGFGALLGAIIEGPERGWTDPLVIGGFVLAVVCLVGFELYQKRAPEPMLDMKFGSSLAQLPAELQSLAGNNIAKALAVSRSLDPQLGADIRAAVQQAFVDAGHVALRLAAVVVAIGAVAMYRRLPDSGEHGADH